MGADLNTWVEVVNRHPVKWKFDGLDGFHEEVGEAAVMDEQFMDNWMEEKAENDADALGEEIATGELDPMSDILNYVQWLRDKNHETEFTDDEDYKSDKSILDEYDDKWERRYFYGSRQDYSDCEIEWEWLRSEDAKQMLLEKHPPVEIWDHAYEEGVELDKVLFLCPGCGRNPAQESYEDIWGNYFNCGLCVCGTLIGEDFTLIEWCEDMGVELYPFSSVKRENLLAEFSALKGKYALYVEEQEQADKLALDFSDWRKHKDRLGFDKMKVVATIKERY